MGIVVDKLPSGKGESIVKVWKTRRQPLKTRRKKPREKEQKEQTKEIKMRGIGERLEKELWQMKRRSGAGVKDSIRERESREREGRRK